MSLDNQQVIEALPAYQIEGEIGRGGWGVVLSATHLGLGRRVAVKQLPRAFGIDPTVRRRFKEEARLVASLTHPHIVPIFDYVEYDGLCLIVMELLTGGSLWDRFLEQGVPLDQACALLLAACAALKNAHDHGILHRDIKPENFLFSESGTIKLSDFGIAKVVGQNAAALTVAGSIMGTPAYMAPEQALGLALGPGTDIYSLGVMLYELSCGDLPFAETQDPLSQLQAKTEGEPRQLLDLRPDLDPELAEVAMRAIAREPGDRYGSANDLGVAIASAATQAFGAGWLRRSGVEVMGAAEMIAITEQTPTAPSPSMHPIRLQRATSRHPRIGTMLNDARHQAQSAERPSADPTPNPAGVPGPAPIPNAMPIPPETFAPPTPFVPFVPAQGPGPGPGRAPGRSNVVRSAAIICGALVISGAIIGAGVAISGARSSSVASTGAPTSPAANDSTTTSSTSATSTSTSTSTTAPTNGPEITDVKVISSTSVAISWADRLDPGAAHVLIAYTTGGKKQQNPVTSSPQPVQFGPGTPYCFEIASIGHLFRRSEPRCINGADPALVIVHDSATPGSVR